VGWTGVCAEAMHEFGMGHLPEHHIWDVEEGGRGLQTSLPFSLSRFLCLSLTHIHTHITPNSALRLWVRWTGVGREAVGMFAMSEVEDFDARDTTAL
jgi:hypothetical protein